MSFFLESLPLPFPWMLCLLLQLCPKSHCGFGFLTPKAVTFVVNLKDGLFWGWESLRVTTAASDCGAHQSHLAQILALEPEPKQGMWQYLWEFMAPNPWVLLGHSNKSASCYG